MKNGNAIASGSATGFSVLIVWLVGRIGWADLSAEEGALVAGGVTTGLLWFGKRGVRGVARLLWRGEQLF